MEHVDFGWNEFWAEVFRVKYRQIIPGIQQYDEMVVEFCLDSLNLKKGMSLLDIACGAGDQSILFSRHGLKVSGFDLSAQLIEIAKEKASEANLDVDFSTGDMREIDFPSQFDAAVLLSHSFGFFNHDENKRVLEGSFNALVEGGKLFLDLMNPYNLPRFQKTWTKLEEGYLLIEPHVLDAPSGVLRGRPASFIDVANGRIIEMNEDALAGNDIRMYTALEIRELLKQVGFSKSELYGQNKLPRMPYAANSERMVVVATK
ncbi:MAG: class I SAM-dependent methyltransferase [Candidatus Thorarchaeota archaeon]